MPNVPAAPVNNAQTAIVVIASFVNSRFFMMFPRLMVLKLLGVKKVLRGASSRCNGYGLFSGGVAWRCAQRHATPPEKSPYPLQRELAPRKTFLTPSNFKTIN